MQTKILPRLPLFKLSSVVWVLIILFSASLRAQQFQKTYAPPFAQSYDQAKAYCVQPTSDGGYIVAGHSNFTGTGNRDAVLVKTDANGTIQWTFDYAQTTAGAFIHEARYVIEVDDAPADGRSHGYVFVGYTWDTDQNGILDKDVLVVKVAMSGALIWSARIGDPSNDYHEQAFAVRQDPNDGHYVLVGGAEVLLSGTAVESRLLMMKVNQFTGTIIWDNAYGEPIATYDGTETQGYSLDMWDTDRDGTDDGWVIAGWVTSNYNPLGVFAAEDIYLIGTDWNGNTLGLYRIGVSEGQGLQSFSTEYASSVIQKSTGDIIIAGEYTPSINDPASGTHPTLLSLNSNFHMTPAVTWMRYYTGTNVSMQNAHCVRQSPYGLVVASSGTTNSLYNISNDPAPATASSVMFHTNTLGSFVNWGWHYKSLAAPPGGAGNGHSVRVASNGFVMAGFDASYGPSTAMHLVKTDWFGSTRCDEEPVDIEIETVEPYMYPHGTRISIYLDNLDISMDRDEDAEQKYGCCGGVPCKRVPNTDPTTGTSSGLTLAAHPNPLSVGEQLSFGLESEESAVVTITASDMAGRIIHSEETVSHEGNNNFHLKTDGWPAGTYTLRVERGEDIFVNKIILVE